MFLQVTWFYLSSGNHGSHSESLPCLKNISLAEIQNKRVLLNRAPTSTQLHPPPLSSFQPPPSSFQPPPSFLQHPKQYLKQNIARNWAISSNLGRKIKNCPF